MPSDTRCTADDLLSGPRGRRVCWELLPHEVRHDPATHDALWRHFWSFAPSGRSLFSMSLFGDIDHESAHDVGPQRLSPAAVEDHLRAVATLIDETPVPAFTSEQLHDALLTSVGAARPWGEVDDEDRICAHPAVRAALEPIAHRVCNALGDWLTSKAAVRQWYLFRGTDERIAPRAGVEHDGTTADLDKLEAAETAARAAEAKRRRLFGPLSRKAHSGGGSWWSAPAQSPATTVRLPECLDLEEDSFGEELVTAIPVDGLGRVYEITTEDDWAQLCRDFPLDVTYTMSGSGAWEELTGRTGDWVHPDWRRVAERWDGVHLTLGAYLSAATRPIRVDETRASVIAGWDPDATYWLTDRLRPTDDSPVRWEFGEADAAEQPTDTASTNIDSTVTASSDAESPLDPADSRDVWRATTLD